MKRFVIIIFHKILLFTLCGPSMHILEFLIKSDFNFFNN